MEAPTTALTSSSGLTMAARLSSSRLFPMEMDITISLLEHLALQNVLMSPERKRQMEQISCSTHISKALPISNLRLSARQTALTQFYQESPDASLVLMCTTGAPVLAEMSTYGITGVANARNGFWSNLHMVTLLNREC